MSNTLYGTSAVMCVCLYEKVINILMFLVVFFLLLFKCVKLGVFKCSPLLLKMFWVAKKFPYLCCCCWYQRLLWSIITYVDGENLKSTLLEKKKTTHQFFFLIFVSFECNFIQFINNFSKLLFSFKFAYPADEYRDKT